MKKHSQIVKTHSQIVQKCILGKKTAPQRSAVVKRMRQTITHQYSKPNMLQ